ncbi:hypothetical protein SETIT_5G257900v2 [Setaria italica]|uniref:Uncharacterized protein n=1 Tax=Setaria italica TaxID=4555 RepID=A0A368R8U3_SETIT|nr:hypothetical protein SETIT_5G257900v2 [Setaria italica]
MFRMPRELAWRGVAGLACADRARNGGGQRRDGMGWDMGGKPQVARVRTSEPSATGPEGNAVRGGVAYSRSLPPEPTCPPDLIRPEAVGGVSRSGGSEAGRGTMAARTPPHTGPGDKRGDADPFRNRCRRRRQTVPLVSCLLSCAGPRKDRSTVISGMNATASLLPLLQKGAVPKRSAWTCMIQCKSISKIFFSKKEYTYQQYKFPPK